MKTKKLDYDSYLTYLDNPLEMVKHPLLWLKSMVILTIVLVIFVYLIHFVVYSRGVR